MPYYGGDIPISDASLHEFMWDKLESHGNETAIVDASRHGKWITYKDLLNNSRKCAAYLQGLGIKKGDYISVFSSNRLEFAYLMLGIIGSGAVLTPCKDFCHENEILYEFDITKPRIVFVDEERLLKMEAVKKKLPFVEHIFVIGKSQRYKTVEEVLAEGNEEFLPRDDIDPENDIAMASYSSGTTGLPKCVLLTHKAMILRIKSQCWNGSSGRDTFYIDRGMYLLVGFMAISANLLFGNKIIVEEKFQLQKMFEDIEKYNVTVALCLPPTVIKMINAKNADKYDLSSLKMVLCGGAPIASFAIEQMRKRYHVIFIAVYGITEGGMISTGPVKETDTTGAAGKIEPGVEVKICDLETRQECEYGCKGEIYVRSPQVTKGYLKNAHATAMTFDDGWLQTGDIGSIDTQGNICITDRIKEVIKYKTLQISPAELESIIIQHPKVADVGVIGVPDAMCGEIPKAFVVPADGTLSKEEVHDVVNSNLSEYKKLRGGIEFVKLIPKSPSGKIERLRLKNIAGV